jgi:hypothetical protein
MLCPFLRHNEIFLSSPALATTKSATITFPVGSSENSPFCCGEVAKSHVIIHSIRFYFSPLIRNKNPRTPSKQKKKKKKKNANDQNQ